MSIVGTLLNIQAVIKLGKDKVIVGHLDLSMNEHSVCSEVPLELGTLGS